MWEQDRYPSRRTFERRLAEIPAALPAQSAWLGRYLLGVLQPWETCGQAAAIDRPVLRANGGVWHTQDRDAGVVPHTSIDTEAQGTKSGWHGWVYGGKLQVVTTVAAVWLPLAADVTPAHGADNELAFAILATMVAAMRFLLGDSAYTDPELREDGEARGITLVTTKRGP